MGFPVSVPRPAGVRRWLRLALITLSALSIITCAEDPVGPAASEGRLKVVPVFEASARLAPLAIDRVRVLVTRILGPEQQGPVVVDDTIPFDLDEDRLTIRDIRVTMQEQTEDVEVTLEMLANTVLLFQGRETVTLQRGRTSSATNIPMIYQGPGANVVTLAISPRDTTLALRANFTFRLDAFDIQGAPVPQHYASWSLVGGPAAGARINSAGQLTAPAVPDTFYVKAVNLPTGVTDSTRVIIGTVTPPPPAQVIPTPLAAGDRHTCEIRGNTTYCWGSNSSSQLGDGTSVDRVVPTPVLGGQVFVAVSAGYSHTCGLTAQGTAFCWGDNSTGALGDGTTTDRASPVPVSGGLTYAQIAAGLQFTCAVTLTGEGRCWGANFSGQLGDGTTTQHENPTLVSGNHNLSRISSGAQFDISSDHTCAIDANGAAWCWGDNSQGQLGSGTPGTSNVPVAVTGGLVFSEISVGGRSSCAITTTGSGFCWGLNFGVPLSSPTPVAGGFTYSALDMGDSHVCGKTATGWVCGGDGSSGQLGDGTSTDRQTPVAPAGGRTFSVMAAGGRHTCGVTATGTFCWGNNNSGQLGDGDAEGVSSDVPVAVMGAPATISIIAGNNQTTLVNVDVGVPPQIRVLDQAGQPVVGAEVVFTVTAGGGTINGGAATYSALTGSDGTLGVTWTLGPNPGANGLSARVSANGVTGNPVSFTATATSTAAVFNWTGAVSNDWAVAGNWSPAQVPGLADSVAIGAAPPTQPLLTGDVVVGAVSISGGRLTVNGHGLLVARGLNTSGTGVLVMQNPGDVVSVAGSVVFDGGNELNLLTTGGLSIGGNLTQRATNSGDSFHPSGSHITLFTGTAPIISFATPGLVPGTSHFQELAWVGGGSMTLLTPVMAHGNLTIAAQAAGTISSGNGSRLTVGNLITAAGLTLNDVPLTISQTVSGALSLNSIAFQAMPTNVSQLVISHPGSASAFTFTNLQFSTAPVAPNGFYLDVTDNNGATDGVLTINMDGAAPASGDPFVRTAGGAVVTWPFQSVNNWTGAVSTDWSAAGNWSLGLVPGPTADVTVTGTAIRQPTLSANTSVHNITISGAGARLTIGGLTFTVTGDLVTHTDGLLVMTNPADRVSVLGDATFQGGDETGLLSAGELQLSGGFGQQVQTSPFSFRASGTHRTVMRGTALQTVRFCCTANTSGFQNLDLSQTVGINIQFAGNGVFVFDTLISQVGAGTAPWLYMLGSPLTARRFRVDKLLVDRGTLTLNEQGVVANQQFDNVTFQNYLPTQTQLALTAAGGSPNRTLTFSNLSFQPLTTGDAGKYLAVTSSAQTLIVNLPGATPAGNGPAFTTVSGGATVNWPAPTITWTGAVSTDWHTAGNWNAAVVPGATANVVIPSGTANSPTMSTTFGTINSLLVAPGATLTLTTFSLTVAGNVDVGGAVAGSGALVMTGTGATLRGAVSNLTINGGVTLNGNTTTAAVGTASISGAGADLNLGGFTFEANNFLTQNGATLTMTNPADSLVATGTAQFTGGSTLGRLTAGVIELRASLSQTAATSTTSFASTGTRVRATGNTTVTYTFNSGGITGSRFSSLIVSKGGGALNLSGTTVVATDSIAVTTATSLSVSGTLLPLRTLRLAAGAGLAGAGTVRLTGDSLFVATPANYTIQFTDFNGSGPQLIPALNYVNLAFTGTATHTLTGTTTATGGVNIGNPGGVLVLANRRFTANLFNLSGTAVVNMTQPLDSLLITGNAAFNGGDETGFMTAGVLRIDGSLTVSNATALVGTGTHKTIFAGATNQIVSILAGGAAATRFHDLEVRNSSVAGVTFNTTGQVMQVNGVLSLPTSSTLTGGGTVVAGGVSTVGGSTLSVFSLTAPAPAFSVLGNYGVNQTFLTSGGVVPPTTYNNLTLTGNYTLGANLSTTGNLEVQNRLDISARTVSVARTFRTTGVGVLVMANPSTAMTTDSAVFSGGDETGLLTDGILTVTRAFVQRPTNSPASFFASGSHTLNFTGAVVDIDLDQFTWQQSPINNLTSSAGNTFVTAYLKVNGNATFSGSNVNAGILNVRGTLTTAPATGLGIDSIILGGALTAGNGYIAANHYIFDQVAGTQTVPASSANLPYNLADIFIRSNALVAGPITTNGLRIEGPGRMALNGQTVTVTGPFATAGNGVLVSTNAPDALLISGNATFDGGDETGLLTAGAIRIDGSISQIATNSPNSFRATGTHSVVLSGAGTTQIAFATAGSQFQNLLIDMPSGTASVTGGSVVAGGNLSVTRGQLVLNGHRVDVAGNFSLNGSTSTVAMQNTADSLFVTGTALFAGASTSGTLTNGVLRIAGNFIQNAVISQLSFAPSGLHKTVLGAAAARTVSMGSPGLGGAGSHFQVLDVTPATGGVSFDVNLQADSLISTTTAARITSSGVTLTARRSQVTGLTFDGTYFALDEQGVAAPETFSNVTYTNFSGGGNILLTVTGPGNSFAPRPTVTTANVNFPTLGIGAANFYVDLTTTNNQAFQMTMTGSNQGLIAGGNGAALTRVTPATGIATVSWP